jgi:hypothetical protein
LLDPPRQKCRKRIFNFFFKYRLTYGKFLKLKSIERIQAGTQIARFSLPIVDTIQKLCQVNFLKANLSVLNER